MLITASKLTCLLAFAMSAHPVYCANSSSSSSVDSHDSRNSRDSESRSSSSESSSSQSSTSEGSTSRGSSSQPADPVFPKEPYFALQISYSTDGNLTGKYLTLGTVNDDYRNDGNRWSLYVDMSRDSTMDSYFYTNTLQETSYVNMASGQLVEYSLGLYTRINRGDTFANSGQTTEGPVSFLRKPGNSINTASLGSVPSDRWLPEATEFTAESLLSIQRIAGSASQFLACTPQNRIKPPNSSSGNSINARAVWFNYLPITFPGLPNVVCDTITIRKVDYTCPSGSGSRCRLSNTPTNF